MSEQGSSETPELGMSEEFKDLTPEQVEKVRAQAEANDLSRVIAAQVDSSGKSEADLAALETHQSQLQEGLSAEVHFENKRLSKELNTDHLTGLWNDRALHGAISRLTPDQEGIELKDRRILNFRVVMFDLSGLKTANDMLGRDIGDQIITEAAKAVSDIAHELDLERLVFRAGEGADEFIVICPTDKVERLISEVEKRFGQRIYSREGKEIRASLPGAAGDTLFEADSALKEIKHPNVQEGDDPRYRGTIVKNGEAEDNA